MPSRPEPLVDPALVDDALGALHERYRAPLILHYLEERSHEEGARLLNIPVGTFAGRLSRGRKLLASKVAWSMDAPTRAWAAQNNVMLRRHFDWSKVDALIALWCADGRASSAQDAARLIDSMRSAHLPGRPDLADRVLVAMQQRGGHARWGAPMVKAALTIAGIAAAAAAVAVAIGAGALRVLPGDPWPPPTGADGLPPQAGPARRPAASAAVQAHPDLATSHPQDTAMPDIEITTVAPLPCALVRGVLHRATIGTEIRALFDRYYAAAGQIPRKGLNFCLYRDSEAGGLLDAPEGIPVEIGTLFDAPIAAQPGLVPGQIPGGRCAHASLWGDYSGLPALHRAIDAWCMARGEAESPIRWEIYGHMYDDLSKVRTDVYVPLKDAKPSR